MKIATVLGSPRKKGNSSSIALAFSDKAQSLGAEVSTYHLNAMRFRGCQGCMACKETLERCAQKDDLTEVLDAIHAADVLVMASPVYYHSVSGQLKTFLDRTFSFLKPNFFGRPDPCRLPPGKKALLILSQAHGEDAYQYLTEQYAYFMKAYGMEPPRFIRAVRLSESSRDEDRKAYVEEAQALAQEWCGQ
ncbi:MAG TPA: flavodoxin family protein [Solidesulfovibrio sp.]|nr:flavodoxin family protein [Solidesulfovibrio sp.]